MLLLLPLLVVAAYYLGKYLSLVYTEKLTFLSPLERLTYKIVGIEQKEMGFKSYLKSLIFFNGIGFIVLFLILLFQGSLPLNPESFSSLNLPLAFNIATSFVTNTNWQSYAGETTLSYFSQTAGLAVQNFLSAATGMAILLALIRGITRKTSETIGNFWVDITKTLYYVLLPLSIILSLFLVIEGSVQTFAPYQEIITLEGSIEKIPLGPVASQVAIKQLGSNGGGFFNTNSAHPFENPTPFSNFLETFAILLIPSASVFMYGNLVGSKRQSYIIFAVMLLLWLTGLEISLYSESLANPAIGQNSSWEGKEVRFGVDNTLLWSVSTTATSNGSVNGMISSLSPLAGGVALFNILLGEMIFGGVGVGLASFIMFILLTVFLSGLMVGRTPEYLGKKIEKNEMQWNVLSILIPSACVLIGFSFSAYLPSALSSVSHAGPHGLSELLYAFASASGNNGSAFAGLNANTDYFNIVLGIIMIVCRLAIIVPSLAIASFLAKKKKTPETSGTLSSESLLFALLLASVILIIGALTFFPALSLGPIMEHLLMQEGKVF